MKFSEIPQLTKSASYKINVSWDYLSDWLSKERSELKLDLDPDFQRAHVWDDDKRRKYVEYILRGGKSSRELQFNCIGWMKDFKGPFVIVDGKQRLEAVTRFMNNKLSVFGSHYLKDFEDKLRMTGPDFVIHVNDLKTRAEVLQWYCDLNAGGVAHTDQEIKKVEDMLTIELDKL